MESHSATQKQPADYLKIFFRRKWFLIIPVVIGMVGGIIAGNIMPKSYESSTFTSTCAIEHISKVWI